jgi:hypothetical protein
MEGAHGSVARGGGRRPCQFVIDGPHLSCLIDDNNDESTKGRRGQLRRVDARRRMALAHQVCGLLPTLEGRV